MIEPCFQNPPADFRCLAIETSSAVGSIAACADGRLAQRSYGPPGPESRQVYRYVREVLSATDVGLEELDCIAFGQGPGGFTGLRVGAAVVQALAYGNGLPVCRVSSLAVLAAAAMRVHDVSRVAACVDARMGEAYLGVYSVADGSLRTGLADRLVVPDEFRLPDAGALFAAGGGWAAYPNLAAANAALLEGRDMTIAPGAEVLLVLAARAFAAGRTVQPHEAVPNYVRDKVTS